MYRNHLKLVTKWKHWLTAILFVAALSACGGQAEEVAMSEQVPVRRGSTEVLGEIQDIIAEILGIPFADVAEDADFRQDLGADDDAMARIAEVFEEAFTIELTDEEIEELTTVSSAAELVASKQE